jgi:CubicO group peptidase (beta-lactamase class C family)
VTFDAAALAAYLAHARVERAGTYRYSELGVAVLGEAVARAYRKDYRHLIASEVLAPLALNESGFGNVPHLVDGYRDGKPVPHWQHQAFAPASGLRASLSDMMRFAAAALRPDRTTLRAAILLARQPRAAAGGGETALAWQIVPVESDGQTWPLLWQAGITGGFASFVGLRTDRQRAVVLLGNAGVDLSALGLTLMADRSAPPAPPKLLPTVAPASLAYPGLYRFDTGGDLLVRATDDGLSMQVGGYLPQAMSAYDEDAFEIAGAAGQLTFERREDKVVGAILHRSAGAEAQHGAARCEGARRVRGRLRALELDARARYRRAAGPSRAADRHRGDVSRKLRARPLLRCRRHARDRLHAREGRQGERARLAPGRVRGARDARRLVTERAVQCARDEAQRQRQQDRRAAQFARRQRA